jgi:hypothetical protein
MLRFHLATMYVPYAATVFIAIWWSRPVRGKSMGRRIRTISSTCAASSSFLPFLLSDAIKENSRCIPGKKGMT